MKRNTLIFLSTGILMVMGLLATACSNEETLVPIDNAKNIESIDKDNIVSLQNVQTLVRALSNKKETRAAVDAEDFVFVTDDENDTLFFVVNYPGGGWTMYASDKRVPAVVAENKEGHFDLKETERVMGAWFEAMKEDMKAVRLADDKDLNFTTEEIEANCNYWDAVCNVNDFVQARMGMTRSLPMDSLHNPVPLTEGHYELDTIYYNIYNSQEIDHLTDTRWHQHPPYNRWCPTFPDSNLHPNAGCVAIAGAQMLYYLHYKIGVPDSIPDRASCTMHVGDATYDGMQQWNSGIDTWSLMPNDGNDENGDAVYAAPLIANVGKRVNMQYGHHEMESGAVASDLVNNVFEAYNISCQYVTYDIEKTRVSLENEIPVIASAGAITNGHPSMHAFIIDGYKSHELVTTYVYKWVWDILPPSNNGMEPITMTDSIAYNDTKHLDYIKMNWGWGNHSSNNTWYAPTTGWVSGGDNYQYNRHIIYDFSIFEEE